MTGPYNPDYSNGFGNQDNADWQAQYHQPYYPGGYPDAGNYPGYPDTGYYGAPMQMDPHTPQPSLDEARFGPFDIGQSFTYSWKAFAASWAPWVLSSLMFFGVLLLLILMVMIYVFGVVATIETGASYNFEFSVGMLLFSMLFIITVVYGVVWMLNNYRNALKVVRGETITLGDFFRLRGLGTPFLVYVLFSLIMFIGFIFFYIPGFVAAVILLFAVPATFHIRDCGVGEAFATTWRVFRGNIGPVILLFLVAGLLNALGGMVMIGAVVTAPLVYLMYAHALQTAIGGPIAYRV